MKFLRILFLGVIALSICSQIAAQSFSDNALLFSRTMPGGSARVQALGGAQTALGGDYSSALSNPAGLGMFNHSEFTFSPGINFQNSTADFKGNSSAASKSTFNIPGLSLILHHDNNKGNGFLGGSFGVTMTRTNDLNQVYNYEGVNRTSSIVDYFVYNSYDNNGKALDPNSLIIDKNGNPGANFYTLNALAYNNGLIYDYKDNNNAVQYYSDLIPQPADNSHPLPETRTETQKENVRRQGSQYQWSIAYGGNFSDKLFFGLSVGITSIKYKLTQSFMESNFSFSNDASFNPVDHFKVDESLEIRGSGLNLTAGLIYRPVNIFQAGLSIATPTYYQITDTYNASVSSLWTSPNASGNTSFNVAFDQPVVSNYTLTTPFRVNAGLTFFVGKYGFITGDAEFVNYSQSSYTDQSLYGTSSYDQDNAEIKSSFKSVVNFHVGGEFRYEMFRARAGYAVMADPYKTGDPVDRKIQNISGGLGFKSKKYSVDFATIYSQNNNLRRPYNTGLASDPVSQLQFTNLNFVLTFGVTF